MKAEFVVESSESTQTCSWWARWEWRWRMIQPEKQCRIWYFHSPFHMSSALLTGYRKVISIAKWSSFTLHACSDLVQLLNISPHPLQIFVQLEQCASYRGSRRILSRRQHVPNKQCALNNDVHLITWFNGTCTLYIVHTCTCTLVWAISWQWS